MPATALSFARSPLSPSRAAAFDARPGARVTLTLTDRRAADAADEGSVPPSFPPLPPNAIRTSTLFSLTLLP